MTVASNPRTNNLSTCLSALIITCEHGGNRIPAPYQHLFLKHQKLLHSHRGFDSGALVMARSMARYFGAPLQTSTVSRLLVDLNRSIGHRNLHMETIARLPLILRQTIIRHYYQPYRNKVEQLIREGITRQGKVIHIACHSFTPHFNGMVRHNDIGLLYDPARLGESALCADWKSVLKEHNPKLKVRRNFPYRGYNDGLTTTLRKNFPSDIYIGVELELNQNNILPPRQWTSLQESIIGALDTVLRSY